MTLIHVPRPPKSAMNPNRPVSSLLKMQILQLHDAERKLPPRYQTDIYINAIKTEGEAAEYIRQVTTAIHGAHDEAAGRRLRRTPKRSRVIDIAAVAEQPTRKRMSVAKKKKKKTVKRRRPK